MMKFRPFSIAALGLVALISSGCAADYRAGYTSIPQGQSTIKVSWTKAISNKHENRYAIAITPEISDAASGSLFPQGHNPCFTAQRIDASSFNVFLQDCFSGAPITAGRELWIDWAAVEVDS
jgi:hypothetical protein